MAIGFRQNGIGRVPDTHIGLRRDEELFGNENSTRVSSGRFSFDTRILLGDPFQYRHRR
jgi:hypothetical protein